MISMFTCSKCKRVRNGLYSASAPEGIVCDGFCIPPIVDKDDIIAFFRWLRFDMGLSFHPDDTLRDMVRMSTGLRVFTEEQGHRLDVCMERCRIVAHRLGYDVCDLALEALEIRTAQRTIEVQSAMTGERRLVPVPDPPLLF